VRLLMRYGGKGAKRYLGRGLRPYERGEIRHIASWRARRIVEDCRELIGQRTDLRLDSLPQPYRTRQILPLLALLLARAADLLSRVEGRLLEKRLLRPFRASDEYKRSVHGFTQFDRAARSLGMQQKAFDLMVAENCDIFRVVGRYDRRWYLSDLYLKELLKNRHFDLISIKYERLARRLATPLLGGGCMH